MKTMLIGQMTKKKKKAEYEIRPTIILNSVIERDQVDKHQRQTNDMNTEK